MRDRARYAAVGLIILVAVVCLFVVCRRSPNGPSTAPTGGPMSVSFAPGFSRTPPETLAGVRIPRAYADLSRSTHVKRDGLVDPVCTAVESDAPDLVWKPIENVADYRIVIRRKNSSAPSVKLHSSTAHAASPTLSRGAWYAWSVEVGPMGRGSIDSSNGRPGEFYILTTQELTDYRSRAARLSIIDRVGAAELAMRFGLLQEAERILSLAAAGKEDPASRQLITQALQRIRSRK